MCVLSWNSKKPWTFFLFVCFVWAELGLHCCAQAFSSCSETSLETRLRGLLCGCGVRASHYGGFFCCGTQTPGAWASVVAACRLSNWGSRALEHGLSGYGAWALLLLSLWNLPRAGIEPVSPALAGTFLSTGPPGKSEPWNFWATELWHGQIGVIESSFPVLKMHRFWISMSNGAIQELWLMQSCTETSLCSCAWACSTLCDPRGLEPTRVLTVCMNAKSLKSCTTLCDTVDSSLPGSSVPGIIQTRIWEWVVMPFSRGPSQPRGSNLSVFISPALADSFFTTSPTWKDQAPHYFRSVQHQKHLNYLLC